MQSLATIEFVLFIGFVIWLFTLPSSPIARRSQARSDEDSDASETDRG